MNHLFLLLSSAFLLLLAACQAAPAAPVNISLSKEPLTSSPTPLPAESPAPEFTPHPSPTALPDNWQEWANPAPGLILRYPPHWQESEKGASGADGFWQVETRPYASSLYDQLTFLCVLEANDPSVNARYGESPFIHRNWQGWDLQRNLWLGYGCLVTPKTASPGLEAVLFARHPAHPNDLLILRADSVHFHGILSSLRFLQAVPEAVSSGYYNSPHCQETPSAPAISTYQTAELVITEYAIANETCHPLTHFDGFLARVNALPVEQQSLWHEGQRAQAQAINQQLAAFGLHLEERPNIDPWPAFDLKKETETLAENLVRLGDVSTRSDGKDFLFKAYSEEKSGSQFPVLVSQAGVRTSSNGEQGLEEAVWAGERRISYAYSTTQLFPVGAPARVQIFVDGQPASALSIPTFSPAGQPINGFWGWEGHWVMEIASTLFVDGLPQNRVWGYDEIFDWHLVNGKPLFAARRADRFALVYDGQELPVTYDDIAHGDLCCQTGMFDFQPLGNGALFYARRGGVWFLVVIKG